MMKCLVCSCIYVSKKINYVASCNNYAFNIAYLNHFNNES